MSRKSFARRRIVAGVPLVAVAALAVASVAVVAAPASDRPAARAEAAVVAETLRVERLHDAVHAATAAITGALPDPGADLGAVLAALAGDDGLYGHSGKLRARFVAPSRLRSVAAVRALFGDTAVARPGVYAVRGAGDRPFNLVTLVPFAEKVGGRIGTYRMGAWPFERGTASGGTYGRFDGFIRVTRENQDLHVSEHFRLRDFLTKDQQAVWPKYLVLREPLLDKLELTIAELERAGTPVRHVSVMSGFRTPQYNDRGVGAGGRAQNSRHQYGDAADVFVDNDRNGRLDDLNRDGRIDTRDVQVMVAAVERVERRYPSLVGGAGVYTATSAHGPFVHVDVRGTRARW